MVVSAIDKKKDTKVAVKKVRRAIVSIHQHSESIQEMRCHDLEGGKRGNVLASVVQGSHRSLPSLWMTHVVVG